MEILTGPAGSGKTSALLQWYRAADQPTICTATRADTVAEPHASRLRASEAATVDRSGDGHPGPAGHDV